MKCKNCRFFHEDKAADIAECRRRVPNTMPNLQDGSFDTYWPDVDPEDWCGEHAPKCRCAEVSDRGAFRDIDIDNITEVGGVVRALMRRMGFNELWLSDTEIVGEPGTSVWIEEHPAGGKIIHIKPKASET